MFWKLLPCFYTSYKREQSGADQKLLKYSSYKTWLDVVKTNPWNEGLCGHWGFPSPFGMSLRLKLRYLLLSISGKSLVLLFFTFLSTLSFFPSWWTTVRLLLFLCLKHTHMSKSMILSFQCRYYITYCMRRQQQPALRTICPIQSKHCTYLFFCFFLNGCQRFCISQIVHSNSQEYI